MPGGLVRVHEPADHHADEVAQFGEPPAYLAARPAAARSPASRTRRSSPPRCRAAPCRGSNSSRPRRSRRRRLQMSRTVAPSKPFSAKTWPADSRSRRRGSFDDVMVHLQSKRIKHASRTIVSNRCLKVKRKKPPGPNRRLAENGTPHFAVELRSKSKVFPSTLTSRVRVVCVLYFAGIAFRPPRQSSFRAGRETRRGFASAIALGINLDAVGARIELAGSTDGVAAVRDRRPAARPRAASVGTNVR